jgi:outer membrane protein TolC
MDSRSLFLTANTESVYAMAWLDLKSGPIVVEAPPNNLGFVDDFWFHYVADLGNAGPQDVAAARSEAAALEAEHHAQVNDINARVAKLYADLERQRTQLALDVKAILPQGEAVLAATTASYQAGKTDLLALLDSQSTLFSYELSYARLLSDFAESLADLEQVVGREVLP